MHGEGDFLVAYFSPEFGVDASLPVYSGGLGVLAGDHLKAAGDLGVPIVGVGLFYRQGYFSQSVAQGMQQEHYQELDPEALGLTLETHADGRPVAVELGLVGEPLALHVWRREVRGCTLYLLDSDAPGSSQAARVVTDVLYGGDREHRIRQELTLGVGGARLLAALGLEPTVYHLNEGHAAFLALERIRALVGARDLSFDDALELVRSSTVFIPRCRRATSASTSSLRGGISSRLPKSAASPWRPSFCSVERQATRARSGSLHLRFGPPHTPTGCPPSTVRYRARCGTGCGPSATWATCRSHT
jgi:hypothetical protein